MSGVLQRARTRTPAWQGSLAGLRPGTGALLALILAAGLLLRLHRLGEQPFWVDEAATLGIARLGWRQIAALVFPVEANPPGYYLLMKLWYDLGGGGEAWMRLPSALAGTATLLTLYLFCRRAFGTGVALVAAMLLAVNAQHVRFSQEARTYAVLVLVFSLALLVMQRLSAARPPQRPSLLIVTLGLLTAVLVYLHATGIIIAACLYLYGAIMLRWRWRGLLWLLAAGVLGVVLALPWLVVAYGIVFSPASVMTWQPPLTPEAVVWTLKQVLLGLNLNLLAWPVLLAALACLLAALGKRWWDARLWSVLAMFVLGLASILLISLSLEQVLFERTLLFLLVPAAVLLALGLWEIPAWSAVALALVLLAGQARALQTHYGANHYGHAWDQLAAVVAAAGDHDDILVIGVFEAVAVREYLHRTGMDRPVAVVGLPHEAPYAGLAQAMLAPSALWLTAPDSFACSGLSQASGIWLVSAVTPARTRAALRQAGAMPGMLQAFGRLRLEHWSSPGCRPAELPMAALPLR